MIADSVEADAAYRLSGHAALEFGGKLCLGRFGTGDRCTRREEQGRRRECLYETHLKLS
jgi:hypothetical protein